MYQPTIQYLHTSYNQYVQYFKQFLLLAFVLGFLAFFHPITTLQEDLGRHLLLGNLILQFGHVPHTNLLSYTYPNFPFINSHWLSEVIFTFVFSHIGSFGLLLLITILGMASFGILFYYLLKRFGFFPSLITFLLTLLLFSQRAEVRPQIFSYFFTSVFLITLFLNKEKPTKWLFILIPLELIWVNLHIYFIFGPLLILLFLLDTMRVKKQTKNLILLLAGTSISTLLNPNLLKGALFPFTFWHNYGLKTGENVSTLFALKHFLYPPVYLFCFELGLLMLLLVIHRKKTALLDWLLVIVFSILGLLAVRNLPLFALGVAIPFAKLLFLTKKSLFSKKLIQFHIFFTYFSIFLVIFLSVATIFIFLKQSVGYGIKDDYKPGVDFFLKDNLKGPIFNNFDIGSYLDYRLFPQTKVFVDNRPEAYPVSFFQNVYLPMEQNRKMFYQIDKQYHFRTIIFSKEDTSPEGKQFVKWIGKDVLWVKVYEDQSLVIFKRT